VHAPEHLDMHLVRNPQCYLDIMAI